MPRFAEQVEVAIEALSTNPPQAFEENEFIDASRLVYDGVRDIRKAVLMIRVCPQHVYEETERKTLTIILRRSCFFVFFSFAETLTSSMCCKLFPASSKCLNCWL